MVLLQLNGWSLLTCYLTEHHRASIIDNRHITAAQYALMSIFDLANTINYRQAYRTIQASLIVRTVRVMV